MDRADLIRFIPMRLDDNERASLKAVVSALEISEYVDKVDRNGIDRKYTSQEQIKEFLELCFAMLISCPSSVKGIKSKFKEHSNIDNRQSLHGISKTIVKNAFEACRRYKRSNPTFMRAVFGKLMWILMDMKRGDETYCRPLLTVGDKLSSENIAKLINCPHFLTCIEASASPDTRTTAILEVQREYSDVGDFPMVLNSIIDTYHCMHARIRPVEDLLRWLEVISKRVDLSIKRGQQGSCLTHSHTQQYHFVRNTLVLWKIMNQNMNVLWAAVEDDILNPSINYSFTNTGQGYHRLHTCPRTRDIAEKCLYEAKKQVGGWVGSDVIHLGDRDVPNALVFIDKYSQIALILSEIVCVMQELRNKYQNCNWTQKVVNRTFGSLEDTQDKVLGDFFRNGFNGSGDDGGSCIDGRLTSVWNWCNLIEKKSFYQVFLLCGFQGFDGNF